MFRLCWEKYIIDKKINGYYLWERIAPFTYEERVSGEDTLVDFFVKDDINDVAEHILSKTQSKNIYGNYKSNYKIHIDRTIDSTKEYSKPFDYATFEQFMREFTKVQLDSGWERKPQYPESFFRHDRDSSVHAGLICFDGVFMIMKTLKDYIQLEDFIHKNILKVDDNQAKINKWS